MGIYGEEAKDEKGKKMESMILCITLTAIMAVLLVGIGVCFGRNDKEQLAASDDVRIYIPDRDRSRSSVVRYSAEEMTFVLDNVKRMTHGEERKIMDAIIDMVNERGNE